MSLLTLQRLASLRQVQDLVGPYPDSRWGRASLTTARHDGYSIASWFQQYDPEQRIRLVRHSLLDQEPWSPLVRVRIPKKPGSIDTRAIDMPVVMDQARLYLIHDWLARPAEQVLTRVAVGFRPGVQMDQTILNAHQGMSERPFVAVIDIQHFFDSIAWLLVDRVIEGLPADRQIRSWLTRLLRAPIFERQSGRFVKRDCGIPQGLSVSPVLANLALNQFDRDIASLLSRFSCVVRRYCDDILVICPSSHAGDRAIRIVRDRLALLGLRIKPGTGMLRDIRREATSWLGIEFGPQGLRVPDATMGAKAASLQAGLDQGLIDSQAVEHTLSGLQQYWGRIVGSEQSEIAILSISEKLDIPALLPKTRAKGIDHLRELIHDHGSPPKDLDQSKEPRHLGGSPPREPVLPGMPDLHALHDRPALGSCSAVGPGRIW